MADVSALVLGPRESQAFRRLNSGQKTTTLQNLQGSPARPSQREAPQRLSSLAYLKEHRNSMLGNKGRQRRERTFIGEECAACEEPLEHTLRGERILQLSCGHVSHEACFYEFIKEFESQSCPTCDAPLGLDTSRGGNLDFGAIPCLLTPATQLLT